MAIAGLIIATYATSVLLGIVIGGAPTEIAITIPGILFLVYRWKK